MMDLEFLRREIGKIAITSEPTAQDVRRMADVIGELLTRAMDHESDLQLRVLAVVWRPAFEEWSRPLNVPLSSQISEEQLAKRVMAMVRTIVGR